MQLRRGAFVVAVAVLAAACSRGEAPSVRVAAAPAVAASSGLEADLLVLNDVMEWSVEPAADVVFAAAGLGAQADRRPNTAPAWQAVADAAQQLAEQGHLLMQPAFATHRADWQGLAAAMHRSASDAAEAARRRDADRTAAASDALRASCQGCHLRYAPALARRVGDTR
jgi:hypothetical protein